MLQEFETLDQQPLLDNKETLRDTGVTLTYQDLIDVGIVKEVASLSDLIDALSGDESEVSLEITADLQLAKTENIKIPSGKKAYIRLDKTIECTTSGFVVENGGELVLTGSGTIETSNKSTTGAMIEATGENAVVTVDGVTLDAITKNGKSTANCSHAIYLASDASINFKSGLVKTACGSCIATNNTTGNAKITISGGELHSDGSYALYIPSQCDVEIKGNAIVQGINARMGKFDIKDNARIIGTTLTEEDYDDIGLNINTSGCVWLGDTIAVMAGTYTATEGTECEFNIGDNVKVDSNFRSAIGIYEVDTKEAQSVVFNIANADNITTNAEGFDAITIYDHEYIAAAAEAKGKTFNPVTQSIVEINI